MLQIHVDDTELYIESTEEFINVKGQTLQLEHSLLSLSKWESKWKTSFLRRLEDRKLTQEETIDYVRCMTITRNVDPIIYSCITNDQLNRINSYLSDPMTATTFTRTPGQGPSREIVTAELVYYYMIEAGVPFECEKWNFNRLMALIRVCQLRNGPQKKLAGNELLASNAALNASRRKKYNTRG